MPKTLNMGTGQATQNQNNAMSDDPRDGSRNTAHATTGANDPPPGQAPDDQGPDALAAFGKRGTRQD